MKSSIASRELSIGEVADHFGLATHVLRHWEAVGLLRPGRGAGSRRRYLPADLYRVAAIQRAKEAGLALDEIREILDAAEGTSRRAVLRRQRDQLVRRIAEAQASLDLVECALECDHEDIASCPRFQALLAERVHS